MTDKVFNFSDKEFLEIINLICKQETPMGTKYVPIVSMQDSIDLNRLDSLGMIIFFVWLGELFEINEDAITLFSEKEIFTIQAIKDFVKDNCTQMHTYVEAAEYAKRCL
jgi:hypothetical protein|tara:strand:- start:6072 stop:6398 length:327 start_codon:yes stop_codon:yes gene_type:complete